MSANDTKQTTQRKYGKTGKRKWREKIINVNSSNNYRCIRVSCIDNYFHITCCEQSIYIDVPKIVFEADIINAIFIFIEIWFFSFHLNFVQRCVDSAIDCICNYYRFLLWILLCTYHSLLIDQLTKASHIWNVTFRTINLLYIRTSFFFTKEKSSFYYLAHPFETIKWAFSGRYAYA